MITNYYFILVEMYIVVLVIQHMYDQQANQIHLEFHLLLQHCMKKHTNNVNQKQDLIIRGTRLIILKTKNTLAICSADNAPSRSFLLHMMRTAAPISFYSSYKNQSITSSKIISLNSCLQIDKRSTSPLSTTQITASVYI